MNRNNRVLLLILFSILIPLTLNKANAQLSPLTITLTCNPLSGQAPFSPSCQWTYSANGSVNVVLYWGDGSSSDMTSCGYSCPSHSYSAAGTYTITVSITDSTGRTASDSNIITVSSAAPQTTYNIQVGAWGDEASIGNMGAGVEIKTQIYSLAGQDSADSFWVGDNLQNGAFIQFGYELFGRPGNYCLYGKATGISANCLGNHDAIGYSEARWFWQYWPNANVTDFYSGIGPAGSVGPDGSWHLYQIRPNVANGWNFILDGRTVWSFNLYQVTKSIDQVYMVAEEVTGDAEPSGTLGPVEFRNLDYWTAFGWQPVTSLAAILGCGAISPNCGILIGGYVWNMPYGVTLVGPNDVIAGTGQTSRTRGDSIWPSQLMLTLYGPNGVTFTVDDENQIANGQSLLKPGSHSVSVSSDVSTSQGVQLRFDHWSDGYKYADRSIDLESNTTLTAVFLTQYNLTLISPYETSGEGWYDKGASANFGCNAMPSITNTFGLAIFRGWYDQDGNLYSAYGTGSVIMNRPLTLHPVWLTLDYFFPIVLGAIVAIALFRKIGRREAEKEFVEAEMPRPIEVEVTKHSKSSNKPSPEPFSGDEIETVHAQPFVCRFCNATVSKDRLICPTCGMPVRPL